jgi:hypothetical protein
MPRVAIAFGDEGHAAPNRHMELVQVLLNLAVAATTFLAQACDFSFEGIGKGFDQVFVADQDIFETCQDAVFQVLSLDADGTVTGAAFALGGGCGLQMAKRNSFLLHHPGKPEST